MNSSRFFIRYIFGAVVIAAMLALASCDKVNCQTNLRGLWKVDHLPVSVSGLAIDSLEFYKGDSVLERYTITGDTAKLTYGVYYITDDCSTIVFDSNLVWDVTARGGKYDIVQSTEKKFIFRRRGACDSCTTQLIR